MTDLARRPLWKKKRWWAALLLWLAVMYPLSIFVAGYAHGRGWIATATAERVYRPLLELETSVLPVDPADDFFRWGHRLGGGGSL